MPWAKSSEAGATDAPHDIGQPVRVVSIKYDGALRDTYDAQLLDHVGTALRLSVPADTPQYEAKKDQWVPATDNAIEIYFADRWYNVWHFPSSPRNLWYCNIAMPAEFDGKTVKWVDLDLDVRCHPDGAIKVLDEDEFDQHRVQMSYLDEVVDRALAALDEVLYLAGERKFPFDHDEQVVDV